MLYAHNDVVTAGTSLNSLVAFPVSGGSTSWLSQLSSSVSTSLVQQAQSLISAIGKRKLLAAAASRKLLQGGEPPGGGVKGSGCRSMQAGRDRFLRWNAVLNCNCDAATRSHADVLSLPRHGIARDVISCRALGSTSLPPEQPKARVSFRLSAHLWYS